jgi:hypothetical protein
MPSAIEISGFTPVSRSRSAQLLLQKRHHFDQLFRVLVADIVDPRRRSPGRPGKRNVIDQTQYYTAGIIDMGEIPAHPAMVKKLDRPALDNGLGEQENRHVAPAHRRP